jgi:hypothetical protein
MGASTETSIALTATSSENGSRCCPATQPTWRRGYFEPGFVHETCPEFQHTENVFSLVFQRHEAHPTAATKPGRKHGV